jgi:hypothetical protein
MAQTFEFPAFENRKGWGTVVVMLSREGATRQAPLKPNFG